MITSKRTSPHIPLLHLPAWTNIEIKDVHWHSHRRTRIRNIDNTRDVALDGRTAKQQIDLVVVVAIATQVLDDAERSLAVRDRRVHIVLFAIGVDAEAFEVDVAAWSELRFHGAGDVDRGL
jgi:hypothetical protein